MFYAEAAKQVKRPDLTKCTSRGSNRGSSEVLKENLVDEKKKLVIFMPGVINSTAGVESKTQKIQLIVKAAVQVLELQASSSQEVCG